MGLNKKALEVKIIVIVIFSLLVLFLLLFLSGKIIEWVNMIIDKLFGY